MKRVFSLCLCLMLLLTLLAGCDMFGPAAEKTFSKSGLSITLTEDFTEKDYVSYTAMYESTQVVAFTLKEEKTLFGGKDYSLTEYAELVLQANGLTTTVKTKDGLTYFEYDKTVNGKDFHYTAFVYKADDAYWMVQFATVKSDADKFESDIFKYAKSVTV